MLHTPPKKSRKTQQPKKPTTPDCATQQASRNVREITPPPEPGLKSVATLSSPLALPSPPNCLIAQDSLSITTPVITHSSEGPFSPLDLAPCPLNNEVFVLAPEHAKDIPMMEADESKFTEASPPIASTSKRQRSEDDSQDDDPQAKRSRIETPSKAQSRRGGEKVDILFMFPKKDLSDDEEELARSAPPKSYADMIRRERRLRQLRKKQHPFGLTPRRQLAKVTGQNPFGIETFTEQELDESRSVDTNTPPDERHEREERSAAPEPETPKPRGLFGSLRTLGSATIGRAQSLFGSLAPRSNLGTPEPAFEPTPQVRTEPRGRKLKPVWEIEYPQLPAVTPAAVEEEETESEKKRKTFEAIWGKTNRDYDHLHTESVDGNPDNLPYPIKKKPPPVPPVNEDDLDEPTRAFRQERKKRNLERFGIPRAKKLPQTAPLFGPDSHWARKTVDPRYKEREQTTTQAANEQTLNFDRKRKADESVALTDEHTSNSKQSKSRTFQPYIEDEMESPEPIEDVPSTPVMKKQKTAHQIPQTPRSAMKAPGSVGRSGRSVMFNVNPVASIKRLTPPSTSPLSAGSYNPSSPFKTYADEERDRRAGLIEGSPASTISFDPSPNTRANTIHNSRIHPGDALTSAINDANPRKIDYVWHDPTNPDWRPSLANPQPGTFRFVPEDEEDYEEDMLAELQRTETEKALARKAGPSESPQPPSTPRMSHAELPKLAGTTPSTPTQALAASSASALEAANLERRRAEAAKTRPKTSSRLAEVTSARSRSPSPPGLDADVEGVSPTDSAAKTPSPQFEQGKWTWTDDTNEYISSNPAYPDFANNSHGELIASFALRSSDGTYDDKIKGPDNMTERGRQNYYKNKYNDEWASKEFRFDAAMTYEEAGCGSKYIHDLIKTNDARHPEVVQRCDRRFAEEWDAHAEAIESAQQQGKKLVATFPDRDGVEMLDVEDE